VIPHPVGSRFPKKESASSILSAGLVTSYCSVCPAGDRLEREKAQSSDYLTSWLTVKGVEVTVSVHLKQTFS
jgi:hypothetical protein